MKGIGIYLTYRCNSRCIHCSYGSEPNLNNLIDEEQVKSAFEMVKHFGRLETVKILGGEPTLYMSRLLRVVELARIYGASSVILITNGWWGKNEDNASNIVTSLKGAGLSLLLLSIDSFHAEHIPLNDVNRALHASKHIGIKYCIIMEFLESIYANNFYDRKSEELFQYYQKLGIPILPAKIVYSGKAAEFLSHLHSGDRIIPNKCNPPYTVSFENPSGIAIDPFGYVTLCHGIAIGNTREKSLATILSEYDFKKHPILSAIAKDGPLGLTKLPYAEGFNLEEGYIDSCHLCYSIRKYLKEHYSNYLAPSNCYY
ncbi:MAG: radical SAM protein [Candidatus Thorarchaeota archaeon]